MFRLFCFLILLGASVIDAIKLEVPDEIVFALSGCAVIWIPAEELFSRLPYSALIWGLYIITALISDSKGCATPIGMGDIKLIGLLALMFSPDVLLSILAVSGVFSGTAAALLLLTGKAGGKSEIPFVPFITAGFAASVWPGSFLI